MPEEKNAANQSDSATDHKEAGGKPPANQDAKGADSSTEQPWHKDPRFKEFTANAKTFERVKKILDENGLEDPDDLAELVQSGKAVKGKIDPLALDAILEKAQRLERYEQYWAEQKKRQERGELSPEERAERAERELDQERTQKQREEAAKKRAEETKKALHGYEKEVKGLIEEATIPKDQQPLIQWIFGVANPANDVDITDKKAIKKLVTDQMKAVEAFKQSVIAEYLASKKELVKTGQGAESVGGDKPPRMNLKEARKALLERFGKPPSG